jgi:hypothetical protein
MKRLDCYQRSSVVYGMSVTSLISAFLSFVIASSFIFLRRFPQLVGSTALLSVFLPIGAQTEIPLLCHCFGGYDYSGSEPLTPDQLGIEILKGNHTGCTRFWSAYRWPRVLKSNRVSAYVLLG